MDWLKVRLNLPRDPIVVAMAADTGRTVADIVGAWVCLWCLAHEHTTDGVLRGFDAGAIDHHVGVPGFALAGERRGWLTLTEAGVVFARWDKHNSPAVRKRLLNTERQRRRRAAPDATPKQAGRVPADAIEAIWQAWPIERREGSKVAKAAIRRAVRQVQAERRLDAATAADWLLGRVQAWADSRKVRGLIERGEWRYLPMPAKWFEEQRYNDDLPARVDPFALD